MLYDGEYIDADDRLEEVEQVPVNREEYNKFCYFLKVMDAVDRAHDLGKHRLLEMKAEGHQGYVEFDWQAISRHVAPQLHVVYLQDRERDGYLQSFMKFPCAIVIARTAYVVNLEQRFELFLEGNDAHQDVNSAANALRSLESYVHALEGRRLVDGERSLNQLKRVLKIEL
jgi:hypothetical protein